jgi:hypothetical protein
VLLRSPVCAEVLGNGAQQRKPYKGQGAHRKPKADAFSGQPRHLIHGGLTHLVVSPPPKGPKGRAALCRPNFGRRLPSASRIDTGLRRQRDDAADAIRRKHEVNAAVQLIV